jgi:hypothetical protein
MAVSPSTNNITILRGEVFWKTSGSDRYEHLGNCSNFSMTPQVETLQHYSSMSGYKELDKEAVLQVGADIAITLDEITAKNLARATLGSTAAYTQGALSNQTATFTNVAVGDVYDLGYTDVSIDSVTDGAGTPVPYVLDTHYVVDTAAGVVRIVAIPGTADTAVEINFDVAAVVSGDDRFSVAMLAQAGTLEGGLMIQGNAPTGLNHKVTIGRAQLTPSGGINFVSGGDEWATLELTGKVLKDSSAPSFPYGKVVELSA